MKEKKKKAAKKNKMKNRQRKQKMVRLGKKTNLNCRRCYGEIAKIIYEDRLIRRMLKEDSRMFL